MPIIGVIVPILGIFVVLHVFFCKHAQNFYAYINCMIPLVLTRVLIVASSRARSRLSDVLLYSTDTRTSVMPAFFRMFFIIFWEFDISISVSVNEFSLKPLLNVMPRNFTPVRRVPGAIEILMHFLGSCPSAA